MNLKKQVIPAPPVVSFSVCSRMSMAKWTCCWPSSLEKFRWYNHSPNSKRTFTFSHSVSALCLQIETKVTIRLNWIDYRHSNSFKGYLLKCTQWEVSQRAFVGNNVVMTDNIHVMVVERLKIICMEKKIPQEVHEPIIWFSKSWQISIPSLDMDERMSHVWFKMYNRIRTECNTLKEVMQFL